MMQKMFKFSQILFLSLILIISNGAVNAEANSKAPRTQQCIPLQYINQTPVIDSKTILVEMKGNKFKRIDLVNKCSGLKFEKGFSHSTSINKLCKQDTLRVLRSGSICLIKQIVDITKEEAKALKSKS